MRFKAFKKAFPYTIPIFAGFWFLGLAYGIYVNYPRPKGHGLVTAQSCEWLTPPTFNPDRYYYLKWRYIIGWLTTPFVAEFTLLQLY